MTALPSLPWWDMTVVFPSLESPEFEEGFRAVEGAIAALHDLFEQEQIGQGPTEPLEQRTIERFEQVIERFNQVEEEAHTLTWYLTAFRRTNSRDALAQARFSELEPHLVRLAQLSTRFTAWIGSLDVEALIPQSPVAAAHAFALREAKVRAAHLMPGASEALAAELAMTGSAAWRKLYEALTSQLTLHMENHDGQLQKVPMTVVRSLAYAADREVRRRAYEAELDGWPQVVVPLAAALNSIKGETLGLTKRRGWASPLDEALFQMRIDRETLDVMLAAAREALPGFRRYLRTKAKALGLHHLAWYDLFAPIGGDAHVWNFDEAQAFIIEQFGTYSPKLADFAARAFRERWIDAEPRAGKVGGGFCVWLRRDESRILVNYSPSYMGMSTLAHELGHGYHNLILTGCTPLQRTTPMTMAETASIFCETLVKNAALERATSVEQLEILEASLQNNCQLVVDITSRFLFEQRVFERRGSRELAAEEFCEIMQEAQRETYGDGLDGDFLHSYMWAIKQHYFSADRSFYNFPYLFGLLFGLGCFACYQDAPETFRQRYDDLLASTGHADAATLAERFGIDVHAPSFWQSSFAVIHQEIDRFQALSEAHNT